MRLTDTQLVLLSAASQRDVLAAFLVGGINDGARLVGYFWIATLIIGAAGAIAVWHWPKFAAAMLVLATLGWLAFFLLAVLAAPARPNDVPGARLNVLALLVCLVPTATLLLSAFLGTRVKLSKSK